MSRLPPTVKVTRTPLAGGASTETVESPVAPAYKILECGVRLTQSIGDQEAVLAIDNSGGGHDWGSADVVRVEARGFADAADKLLVEGFVDEPVLTREGQRAVLRATVAGPNSVLDLVTLPADVTFTATAFTSMFDALCAAHLVGYTRTITPHAAAGTMTFPATMKLREALDLARRALVAATGQKWEYQATKNAAVRDIRLYVRSVVVQGTIRYEDALEGTYLSKGSAYHVVNRAVVRGATVPRKVIDETPLPAAGAVLLDAVTDLAAQPFVAQDDPLRSHTLIADRSSGKDPPGLLVGVARNSDNLSVVTEAIAKRYNAQELRRFAGITGNLAELWDYDTGAGGLGVTNVFATDDVYRELVAWDLGAGNAQGAAGVIFASWSAANANPDWKVQGSNDDAAWFDVCAEVAGIGATQTAPVTDATPYRYWRLLYKHSLLVNATLRELRVNGFANLAADPASPQDILRRASVVLGTTGAMAKEFARFDFGSLRGIAKCAVSHSHSAANAGVNLYVQISADGATWKDVAILSSTTSVVIDTFYIDEPDARYCRLLVQDDRAAASANINSTVQYFEVYWQLPYWSVNGRKTVPLAGDAMRGSQATLSVSNLVAHPGTFEPVEYPAPRLKVTAGRYYWFTYAPQAGASATSWWKLDYVTDATGPATARVSADGGATWADVAADAQLRHRTTFNESQLQAQSDDAASQAKYANFVPGGVLAGGLSDEVLATPDMVEKEAAHLVAARGDTLPRLVVVVELNLAYEPGNRVALGADWLIPFGVAGDFDILEVVHEVVPGARTSLVLNDRPAGDAVGAALSFATGRSL